MKPKKQNDAEQPLPEGGAAEVLEYAGLSSIAQEEEAQHEEIQGQQDRQEQAEANAEQADNLDGWRQAIAQAADLIGAAIPEAAPVWNGERVENLAKALARCDEQYGWGGVGGLLGHPLIGLLFASGPLVIGTARAINQAKARGVVDVEAREVKPAAAGGDPMAASVAPAAA